MQVAKLGRKAMPTPAKIGRTIADALIGAVVGLIAGAPVGAMTGSVGMVIFHIILTLTVEDPTPDDSLGIGFAIVGGAMMGWFTIPVGPVVGAVVGAVVGVRSLGGAIAVGCGAGIGAFAGLAAAVGALVGSFISHDGPFHYLAHVFHYLAYSSPYNGASFIVAAGVVVGICAGLGVGRMLSRQKTVI